MTNLIRPFLSGTLPKIFTMFTLLIAACYFSSCEKSSVEPVDVEALPEEALGRAKAPPPACFPPTTCDCVNNPAYPSSGTITWGSVLEGFLNQRATECWEEIADCAPQGVCHPITVSRTNLLCDFDLPSFAIFRTGVPVNSVDVTGMVCHIEDYIESNRPNFPWSSGYYVKEVNFFFNELPCNFIFVGCDHACGICGDPEVNVVRTLSIEVVYAECTPAGCG